MRNQQFKHALRARASNLPLLAAATTSTTAAPSTESAAAAAASAMATSAVTTAEASTSFPSSSTTAATTEALIVIILGILVVALSERDTAATAGMDTVVVVLDGRGGSFLGGVGGLGAVGLLLLELGGFFFLHAVEALLVELLVLLLDLFGAMGRRSSSAGAGFIEDSMLAGHSR